MGGEGIVDTDLRSQNTRKAEEFENGSTVSTEEHNGQNSERLPRDDLAPEEFDVKQLLEKERGERSLREDGERRLDLGGEDITDEVELYLVEELGYNPDSDYFITAGSVEILEDDGSIGVLYQLDEDFTKLSNEGLVTPVIEFLDEEILEKTLQAQLDYSMVSVENGDKLTIGFKYDQENYDPASEEVGKTISWIEDNLPDYGSGR